MYLQYTSYFAPQIQNVSVFRCDSNGNADDGGTYLKVSATRKYCKTYYDALGTAFNNSCVIRYRYRVLPSGTYSAWVTILAANAATDSVVTGALVGTLSADESYEVIVGVLDDEGYQANTSFILTAEGMFMHKDGEMNSIGIGEAVSEENTVTIAEKLTAIVKGLLKVGIIQCDADGKLTIGQTTLWNSGLALGSGFVGGGDIGLRVSKTAYTDPTTVTISDFTAGSIVASCQPYGEYMPGVVRIQLSNRFGGTSLVLSLEGDRVFITGLTEPIDPSDAVNKQYVDGNFAPAGYGLGESYSPYFMTEGGANDITINGFYQTNINTPDSGYWLITHQTHTDKYMFQFAKKVNSAEMAVRTKHSGNWWEWEWVNPPMIENTEYRTTERFQGRPVFVKLLKLDTQLPVAGASKFIPHGITLEQPIDCYGVYANTQTFVPNSNFANITVTPSSVFIESHPQSGTPEIENLRVVIKYLKYGI